MGTRNLTIVKLNNKTKIAQYGQWDGYPEGAGQTIADFLKRIEDKNTYNSFIKKLTKIRFSNKKDEKEVDDFLKSIGVNDGWLNLNQSNLYKEKYPYLNRDFGADILNMVLDTEIKFLYNNEEFKNDTLFCEYYYIIDLDKNTISMNNGKEYTFKEWTSEGFIDKLE